MRTGKTGRSIAWLSVSLFALSYFVVASLLEKAVMADWMRIAVALAPLPFFIWFLWSFIQMQREGDELDRKIQLEALAVAFPCAIVLLMTLGLLDAAVQLDKENFGLKHAWQFFPMIYFGALAIASRRYR